MTAPWISKGLFFKIGIILFYLINEFYLISKKEILLKLCFLKRKKNHLFS